ncbi:MAG: chalcone isomerase family protein [Spirochaetia bacterium]|jgi:hypothetical protein|nr:chalcone isomerase family protein [Spirochaetia bacterium]
MMKKIFAVMMLMFFSMAAFAGPEIAGVNVSDSVSYSGKQYNFNGAGIRKKLILKLYVGSLYTERKVTDEKDVLKGAVSSVIRLDIISGIITSKLMKETVQEGFEKAMGGDTSSLQGRIDSFIAVFSDEISKGDSFIFVSVPGKGVTAYKGDKELVVIDDDKFREVLFSIWLGNDPADKNLKEAMLGS